MLGIKIRNMSTPTTDGFPVKATATSFRVLEAVRDRDGVGVTELALELDLAKSAVYKHLMTLTALGYLVKEGTTYYLSITFQRFGTHALKRYPIHIAKPAIDNLAGTTGKTVNFVVHENGYGVYAYQAQASETNEPPAAEFSRVALHATAGGKAILAFLPEKERKNIIAESNLPHLTEKTITDADELQRELKSIYDRRIAFEREEFAIGYQCVGSPVVNSDNLPLGAVSVSGPTSEMTGKRLEEDIAGLVLSTAKSIENSTL